MIEKINDNEILDAKVIEIVSYGVKVDCNGRSGVIKIPELSWDTFDLQSRVSEICKVGDVLKVKILSSTDDLFYASLREVKPKLNPWGEEGKVAEGDKCEGEVVLVAEYGYLVKLPNDIAALLPSDFCKGVHKKGSRINIEVETIDYSRQKVSVKEV